MSNYTRNILSIIEPDYKGKIILDQIFVEDSESKNAQLQSENIEPDNYKRSSRFGSLFHLIFINTHKFAEDELISMEMSLMDKIPTINAIIIDTDNKFAISSPIDGDVISLYLRPPDVDNQKPIRIDFNITTISSDPVSKVYSINGLMKIPEFFREVCVSYGQGNSFDQLQSVCQDVGLGFATNEESTDDNMTRLCAYDTYDTFVRDIVYSSYKDDNSFFDWYIDPYYYLCFVNVNKQFSLEDSTENLNISQSFPLSSLYDNQDSVDTVKGSLVLTTLTTMAEKNVFIEKYSLKNYSGSVWLNNGYKRYAQWLEIGSTGIDYQQAFVDPLTTDGAENDFILLKGRRSDGDFYKTMNKYMWLGKQSPVIEQGNVHDNYCFSKLLNHQNLQEINKTILEVELSSMNFYIYKYMRIPVTIYESGNPKAQILMKNRNDALGVSNKNSDQSKNTPLGEISAEPDDTPGDDNGIPQQTDQVLNEFLSGYYVVTGIKYKFQNGYSNIKQVVTLSRREWPIPAKQKDV